VNSPCGQIEECYSAANQQETAIQESNGLGARILLEAHILILAPVEQNLGTIQSLINVTPDRNQVSVPYVRAAIVTILFTTLIILGIGVLVLAAGSLFATIAAAAGAVSVIPAVGGALAATGTLFNKIL
jgi:hypothetical protein